MTNCAQCDGSILWGGVQAYGHTFCGKVCAERGRARFDIPVPQDDVIALAAAIRDTACPTCSRNRPVDLRVAPYAVSLLVVTMWGRRATLACRSCGLRQQLLWLVVTFLMGWWGIPIGVIVTPVQLVRGITGIVRDPAESGPSPLLLQHCRVQLAEQIRQQNASNHASDPGWQQVPGQYAPPSGQYPQYPPPGQYPPYPQGQPAGQHPQFGQYGLPPAAVPTGPSAGASSPNLTSSGSTTA